MAAIKPFKLLVLLILLAAIAKKQAECGNVIRGRPRADVRENERENLREEVRPASMSIEEIKQEKATEGEQERYKELCNRRAVMTDAELQSTTERLKAIYKSLPKLLSPIDDFEAYKRNKKKSILDKLKSLLRKIKETHSKKVIQQWSIFAVYKYTAASGNINHILRNIEQSNPIIQGLGFQDQHLSQITIDPHLLLNESLTQAELIQNYILTKPEEYDKIYRFEKPYPGFEENYSNQNSITTFSTFASCTALEAGFEKGPLITDPSVYTIKITFSNLRNARKIASVSASPEQEEVLFPLGTQFVIKDFTKYVNDSYSVLLEHYTP